MVFVHFAQIIFSTEETRGAATSFSNPLPIIGRGDGQFGWEDPTNTPPGKVLGNAQYLQRSVLLSPENTPTRGPFPGPAPTTISPFPRLLDPLAATLAPP